MPMRMLVGFVALLSALGASPSFAQQCNAPSTAEAAQNNMQRRETLGRLGGMLAGMAARSRAGRELGVSSYDARRLGEQLGLAAAGPLTRGLDQCDQQWVTATTSDTLETGQETTWTGQGTGASGTNRRVPTDAAILRAHPGQTCRTVEQQINQPDGSSGIQTVTACRGEDGVWQPVS